MRAAIVLTAYMLSVLLGNLCMTQIAHAMQPQIPAAPLMSVADVPECPFLDRTPMSAPSGHSPCADGHCLTVAPPDLSCFPAAVSDVSAPALTLSAGVPFVFILPDNPTTPVDFHDPPVPIAITTVVQRK